MDTRQQTLKSFSISNNMITKSLGLGVKSVRLYLSMRRLQVDLQNVMDLLKEPTSLDYTTYIQTPIEDYFSKE